MELKILTEDAINEAVDDFNHIKENLKRGGSEDFDIVINSLDLLSLCTLFSKLVIALERTHEKFDAEMVSIAMSRTLCSKILINKQYTNKELCELIETFIKYLLLSKSIKEVIQDKETMQEDKQKLINEIGTKVKMGGIH